MPTTTTGKATDFITFSRASLATVTDSDGKIKWAPHNLLLASEQFDVSNWTKVASSVVANAVSSPNGSFTADTVFEDTTTSVHSVWQAFTANAVYTYSVFLKYNNLQYVSVSLNNNSNSAEWASAVFDIQNGTLASQNAATLTFVGTPTITAVGSGWYLCTVSANLTAVANGQVYLAAANASSGASFRGAQSYLGSSRSFYAWGAHLYRSDLGGMVANTSAYPMYNPTTPKNLLGFTEAFDNAAWAGATATVSANTTTAPNGLQTADLMYPASSGSNRQKYQNVNSGTSGTVVVASIYIKTSGMQWIALLSPNGANYGCYFDIINGVKGTEASGVTGSITSLGNGWYRCSVSQVLSSSAVYVGVSFTDTNGGTTVTASGTSGVYLWGAQLSDSASLDPYVANAFAAPTAAAYHGPRLDYDPSTLAAKGLLVEEQRSNVVTNSSDFSAWSNNAVTVTTNSVVAPDGTLTADDLERTTGISDYRRTTASFTGDGTKSVSVYVKYNTSPSFTLLLLDSTATANRALIEFGFTAGVPAATAATVGSVEAIENCGNGWYRIKILAPGVVAANTNLFSIYPARTGSSNGQKTTFWGAQAENGSFATSYIPTGASTVTRSADVATVATSTFPYNVNSSSLVIAASQLSELAVSSWTQSLDNGTGNDRFITIIGPNRPVNTQMTSSLVGQFNQSITPTSTTTPFKHAFAYELNNANMAVNGVLGTDDTTVTPPAAAATTLRIGTNTIQSVFFNGHIRQITYLPRRISNTELIARTA